MKKQLIAFILIIASNILSAQGWSGNTPGNIYYNSGNVGIGTPNPNAKLTVAGEIHINWEYPYIQFNSSHWNDRSFIQNGVNLSAQTTGDYMVFYNPSAKGYNFRQGNYNLLTIEPNGNIGIGTSSPQSKLTVAGDIQSRKVKVTIDAGADFVFEEDYDLKKLGDLQKYIQQHKHLPEIPSAKEMEAKGIELGEMNVKLLQKIEELTLYVIDQNKKLEQQSQELKILKEKFEKVLPATITE